MHKKRHLLVRNGIAVLALNSLVAMGSGCATDARMRIALSLGELITSPAAMIADQDHERCQQHDGQNCPPRPGIVQIRRDKYSQCRFPQAQINESNPESDLPDDSPLCEAIGATDMVTSQILLNIDAAITNTARKIVVFSNNPPKGFRNPEEAIRLFKQRGCAKVREHCIAILETERGHNGLENFLNWLQDRCEDVIDHKIVQQQSVYVLNGLADEPFLVKPGTEGFGTSVPQANPTKAVIRPKNLTRGGKGKRLITRHKK